VTQPDARVMTKSKVVRPSGLDGDEDALWDLFDSDVYFANNYRELRKDDKRIIEIIAAFFHRRGPREGPGRAIDVGTGANLYPALSMLPFASEVRLCERAHSNRSWLLRELIAPQQSWEQFWTAIADGRAEYEKIKDPLDLLAYRAKVRKGNVYELKPDQFDLGTMFFVAESITTRNDQFRRATRSFLDSLRPRAPFAAAFMLNSSGYYVGDQRFPACSVTMTEVEECLAPLATIEDIETVESHDLREGYCGMMVATGRRK
jgi:NNMT/PNMT/TEMT family protein